MKSIKNSAFIRIAAAVILSAVISLVSLLTTPGVKEMRKVCAAQESIGVKTADIDGDVKPPATADEPAADTDAGEEPEKLSFTEKVAKGFAESSFGQHIPPELVVVFVSMLPILELRAGLFVAKFLGLPLVKAIPLCIVGNIIPIPLILLFIKKIFYWMGKTKLFHKLIEKLEARAMKKSKALANGEFVGLMLFVGIPIPGTGAWMGSLIAALLEVDFKKAIIAELVGIAIATVIVSILSYGLLGLVA